MASSPKIIAIVGATGGQGGSIIKALVRNPSYTIRAITRDPKSSSAVALADQGCEVVPADLNDEASLVRAFSGASIIFGVTNFFETFAQSDADEAVRVEYIQGCNIANAAAQTSTLEHFIWSTLAHSAEISDGEIVVPHLDAKARVDEFIKGRKELLKKTTFLFVGFYALNLLLLPPFKPTKDSSGTYSWSLPMPPDTPIAHIGDHSTNVGVFVKAIIENPEKTKSGRYVHGSVVDMTVAETATAWAKATSKQMDYHETPYDAYLDQWGKFGEELGIMMKFWVHDGERSWKIPGGLEASDLGLTMEDFVRPEEVWKTLDWSET